MEKDTYIRFDWAAKYMLRDKANFDVLEGLISVLTGEEVKIEEILEGEGNQSAVDDKFNRVDVKARNAAGEIIIVEIQQTRELHYLQRILYGVAKTISEHMRLGRSYAEVKKVYSVSIVYFDLGQGKDYIYHGQTRFVGLNTGDTLRITSREKDAVCMKAPEEVFPDYFIIRVNEYNKPVAANFLEEWLGYLKDGYISEDTKAPGLQEARRKLNYLSMNQKERARYESHLDAVMTQNDVLESAKLEGRAEGLAEGEAKGRAEERFIIADKMLARGLPPEAVSEITGMTVEELKSRGK